MAHFQAKGGWEYFSLTRGMAFSGEAGASIVDDDTLSLAAKDEGGRVPISGTFMLFNVWFPVDTWFGKINFRFAPQVFQKTLQEKQDIVSFFNHDESRPLGRMSKGTMRVTTNDKAAKFETLANPESPDAKSVIVAVQDGTVQGSSMAFRIVKDTVTINRVEDGDDEIFRTVEEAELHEVGPVTFPAFPKATSKAGKLSKAQRAADFARLKSAVNKMSLGLPLTKQDVAALDQMNGLWTASDAEPEPDTHSPEVEGEPGPEIHSVNAPPTRDWRFLESRLRSLQVEKHRLGGY